MKGLLKAELESQSPEYKIINKRRKKLDLIKKLENDLNDQEEEEEKGQINKAYESDTNQTKEKEEKTKKSRKREPKNKIPRGTYIQLKFVFYILYLQKIILRSKCTYISCNSSSIR